MRYKESRQREKSVGFPFFLENGFAVNCNEWVPRNHDFGDLQLDNLIAVC